MTKPVRIRDIAEACGVSVGAVSRALKGQPGLREDTLDLINGQWLFSLLP